MDLDAVADELYGLWPAEFTAARTAREKEARATGDKELAARIKSLGKPTTVGWLANRLVRDHGDELQPLLELGDALREATAVLEGEELRALSQQQHQLVAALVRQARRDAAGSGHRVGEDAARGLEETLRAALADADLSEQLAAGRLTGGLQHAGFGVAAGAGTGPSKRTAAPAGTGKPAGASAGRAGGKAAPAGEAADPAADAKLAAADRARERRERAAARKQAERDLAEARRQAAAAASAHAEAKSAVDEAAAAAASAAARAAELRAELEQASRDQAAAERRRRAAEPDVTAAAKAVRAADRQVRARTAELDSLG